MSNLEYPVRRAVLDNGLRIVHSFDGTTAMAAVNVLYNVGARDEKRSLTGMAHLFEHLMFGGSANVPDYDSVLTAAGGTNNAWTSSDFTNFYITLPAQNISTAFYLESDRMLSLAFNPRSLNVQKGVVVEEFKQTCLDKPYGDLMHIVRRLAYGADHPYSWPVIGLRPEHIRDVAMEDVKAWFYAHYAPNNAILSVAGNVDFDTTLRLANEWFGDIPRRDIASRVLPASGFPTAKVHHVEEAAVPFPMLVLAIPMDSYGTERYFAADAITDLLSAGYSARFSEKLVYEVSKGLISTCDASIIGCEHEGLVLIMAQLSDASTEAFDSAEEMIMDQARRLAVQGDISPRELERCYNNFEANFCYSNLGYFSRATNLAKAEYHGEDINREVRDRRALAVDTIAAEADRLFNRTPYVRLDYRPKQ